jgi:AcrR family transcriptional regulator
MATVTGTTHVRNSRGEGDKLRIQIVDSATALIDAGTDASTLSLRAIARAAGISAPSIYPHFKNLDLLVAAVVDASFIQLRTVIRQAADAAENPRDALVSACAAYFAFGREFVERYRTMFSADGYGPESGATLALLEQLLGQCVAAGASKSTDVHGDSFIVWAAMHGMTTIARPSRREDWRLGASDRSALFTELVTRLARLDARA